MKTVKLCLRFLFYSLGIIIIAGKFLRDVFA